MKFVYQLEDAAHYRHLRRLGPSRNNWKLSLSQQDENITEAARRVSIEPSIERCICSNNSESRGIHIKIIEYQYVYY